MKTTPSNGLIPPEEVPAWKQRGTLRLTASERRAVWLEKRGCTAELRTAVIAVFSARKDSVHTERRRSAPEATFAPKGLSRTHRRRGGLWKRFSRLPKFLGTASLDEMYQKLRSQVVELFAVEDGAEFARLSKFIERMCELQRTDVRLVALRSGGRAKPTSQKPFGQSWVFGRHLSYRDLVAEVSFLSVQSTIITWMTPRTEVTVLGSIRAKARMGLDEALRQANIERKQKKLPIIQDRDVLVLAGCRGSFWRQFALDEAKKTLVACESHLKHFRFRGALSLKEYREAFGLRDLRNKDLQGLGPRHYVAAQVLLDFFPTGNEEALRTG